MGFIKIVKNVFNYLKPSWEGEDGTISYKRSSQFVFVCLIVYLCTTKMVLHPYGFYTLIVIVLTFLLLAGIILVPQIIEALKQLRALKSLFPSTESVSETHTEAVSETETTNTTNS